MKSATPMERLGWGLMISLFAAMAALLRSYLQSFIIIPATFTITETLKSFDADATVDPGEQDRE